MTTRTHLAKQEEAITETGIQARSSDPGTPASGQVWINTTQANLKYYTGAVTKVIGGGGGGGGSLRWTEAANSPLPSVANNIQVYAFQSGLAQTLYALVKVPNGYVAGNQINLRVDFYSPDSSGTGLLQSISTLIRQGTDAVTSTTNQRTSGNSAVSLGGGTVNIPQSQTLDLTSLTGTVNSVAVSGGDYILVQLTRGTDTGASDLLVPVYGADMTFS